MPRRGNPVSFSPLLPFNPLSSHDGSGIWTCYGEPSPRWYLTTAEDLPKTTVTSPEKAVITALFKKGYPNTPNAMEPTAPLCWCRSVHTAHRPAVDRAPHEQRENGVHRDAEEHEILSTVASLKSDDVAGLSGVSSCRPASPGGSHRHIPSTMISHVFS